MNPMRTGVAWGRREALGDPVFLGFRVEVGDTCVPLCRFGGLSQGVEGLSGVQGSLLRGLLRFAASPLCGASPLDCVCGALGWGLWGVFFGV